MRLVTPSAATSAAFSSARANASRRLRVATTKWPQDRVRRARGGQNLRQLPLGPGHGPAVVIENDCAVEVAPWSNARMYFAAATA